MTCLAAALAVGCAIGWFTGFRTGNGRRSHGGRTGFAWNKR